MIETIEYALGTVSNTASYLRLWALSLAHNQLSDVFFNYTVGMGLKMNPYNIVIVLAFYYFFISVSIGVLIGMEGMGALLHTLRLHWVEFQHKFYKGGGIAFQPLSFKGPEEADEQK